MGLDFPYTCPDINDEIRGLKDTLRDEIDEILSEAVPNWVGSSKDEFITGNIDRIYAQIISVVETVRSTNEDMRSAADDQIDQLDLEIEEKEDFITELEEEIFNLKSHIDDLEDQLKTKHEETIEAS